MSDEYHLTSQGKELAADYLKKTGLSGNLGRVVSQGLAAFDVGFRGTNKQLLDLATGVWTNPALAKRAKEYSNGDPNIMGDYFIAVLSAVAIVRTDYGGEGKTIPELPQFTQDVMLVLDYLDH